MGEKFASPKTGKTRILTAEYRKDIHAGLHVAIVLKNDQRTGKQTCGIVDTLFTKVLYHSKDIKVRLTDDQVGRVHVIESQND